MLFAGGKRMADEKSREELAEFTRNPYSKVLYGIILILLAVIALLLVRLYGLPFVPSFDSYEARHRATHILNSIHRFYFGEETRKGTPFIQRANFYAYGGLTIDVSNEPEGDAEILVNGKDISRTLKNAGSFVSEEDGMTYERYDLAGSMEELGVAVGINELVIRYATGTPPAFEMEITKQQKKEYEKAYRQKLFNEKQKKRREH
jgi:hypothetical protein